MRFKRFLGTGPDLETAINAWLEEFEPDVTQMTQTVNPDGTLAISFLFEESFRGQEIRFSAEHGMGSRTGSTVPPEITPDDRVRVDES